jgi:hypothetical protein
LSNGDEIKELSGEGAKQPGYLDGINKARKLCSIQIYIVSPQSDSPWSNLWSPSSVNYLFMIQQTAI